MQKNVLHAGHLRCIRRYRAEAKGSVGTRTDSAGEERVLGEGSHRTAVVAIC